MPFDVFQRRMFKMESLEHPPLSAFIKEFSEFQSCGQVQNILMSFVGELIFVSASGSRRNRLCSQIRMRLLPRSLTSFRSGLREWGERGRECGWRFKCLLRVRGPHFASKVSYSASPQGGVPFRFRLSISMNQPSLWLKTGLKYYQRFVSRIISGWQFLQIPLVRQR